MTISVSPPSAKIYQFPVGGRRPIGGHRVESKPEAEKAVPRLASSGWYHEAAIEEEAQRGSEH